MDKCSKFKVFNMLLLFCAANFLLYRYFTQSGTPVFSGMSVIRNKQTNAIMSPIGVNSSGNIYKSELFNITNSSASAGQYSTQFTSQPQVSAYRNSTFVPGNITKSKDLPLCPLVPPRLSKVFCTPVFFVN